MPRSAPALEVVLAPRLMAAAGDLAARLATVARAVADDLGLPIPEPLVTLEAGLAEGAWQVRVRGLPLAQGVIPEGQLLADANPSSLPEGVGAEPAEHPGSGALASWVPASAAPKLDQARIAHLDAVECLVAALEWSLRRDAAELLGLDETQRLVDQAAQRYPALVREVVGKKIDTAALAQVLRALVREGVPLGDLRDVLEALARGADKTPALTVERVRAALSRTLTHRYAPHQRLDALTLDAEAEEALRGALRAGPSGPELALEPDFAEALIASIRRELAAQPRAVLLVPDELRRHVRALLESELPALPVLSFGELAPEVAVERVATVQLG